MFSFTCTTTRTELSGDRAWQQLVQLELSTETWNVLVTFSATASAGQAVQAGSTLLNLLEFPESLCYCNARACFCCPLTCQE